MWTSIRLLNGGKEEADEETDASEALGCEFLDSENKQDVDLVMNYNHQSYSCTEGRGHLTLLRLDSLLGGGAHVVLSDVISGRQSPQRVSGALSPAGWTHRAPVLGHRRGQPEEGKHTPA